MTAEPTEPCHLCGATLKEGAACTSPMCRQAWEAYHTPLIQGPNTNPKAPRTAQRAEGEIT